VHNILETLIKCEWDEKESLKRSETQSNDRREKERADSTESSEREERERREEREEEREERERAFKSVSYSKES
jgi:hypothetical protein